MKKHMTKVMQKVSDSEVSVYDLYTCELKSSEVNSAIEEYKRYIQRTGKTYAHDENKRPTLRHFVELYFGDEEDYGIYIIPDRYRCTNKNIAERLFSLLSGLAYHDTFRQKYCHVEINGRYVNIINGDY